MTRVVIYTRVSTGEQGRSGLGLAAQLEACRGAAAARGWEVVAELQDVASGGSLDRPRLQEALRLLEGGDAHALMVARLDRATRSVGDFARLLDRLDDLGVQFVALDLGVDTGTSGGRLVANVMASVAAWERDTISERTSAALRALPRERRNGQPTFDDRVRARAKALRAAGLTLLEVARTLEAEGVRPVRGGVRLYPATVRRLLLD